MRKIPFFRAEFITQFDLTSIKIFIEFQYIAIINQLIINMGPIMVFIYSRFGAWDLFCWQRRHSYVVYDGKVACNRRNQEHELHLKIRYLYVLQNHKSLKKEKNMKIFSFKRCTWCGGWNILMSMGMFNLGSPWVSNWGQMIWGPRKTRRSVLRPKVLPGFSITFPGWYTGTNERLFPLKVPP